MLAASVRREVESILRAHAPEKLGNVDSLMSAHRSRESELLRKVRSKYGIAPSGDGGMGGGAQRVMANSSGYGQSPARPHSAAAPSPSVRAGGRGGSHANADYDPTEYARKKKAAAEKAKKLREDRAAAARARAGDSAPAVPAPAPAEHGSSNAGGGGMEEMFPKKTGQAPRTFGRQAAQDGAQANTFAPPAQQQ